MSLFAEELSIGEILNLGTYEVTKGELLEFASQWDPQAFHVNEAVAAGGAFGTLIASGIHTMAIFQRLAVLGAMSRWQVIDGVQLRSVRFLAPVRAGSELAGHLVVDNVVIERSRRRALVTKTGWLNAGDTRVIELISDAYVRTRE